MSVNEKISETFIKPVLVGASGYLGAKLLGEEGVARILGTVEIPLPIFYGLAAAGGSLGAEIVKQWVLPYIPSNSNRSARTQALLISPIFTGLTTGGAIYLASGLRDGRGLRMGITIGAGSELVGQYSYSVIAPYVN